MPNYFAHESAYIDEPCTIGEGTKIWHFAHVMKDAKIGKGCNLGQNVLVASGVVIGNNVKIQNNVAVYTGTIIEDDVFLGPSCVLTNVTNPRSQIIRQGLYEKTIIRRGATIGANATIVCGIELGRYCFIAAGAVITVGVPDYALMVGVPAKQKGWMSRHGHRLQDPDNDGMMICPESGFRYKALEGRGAGIGEKLSRHVDRGSGLKDTKEESRISKLGPPFPKYLRCLDLDEESPLPDSMREGTKTYDEYKEKRGSGFGK